MMVRMSDINSFSLLFFSLNFLFKKNFMISRSIYR